MVDSLEHPFTRALPVRVHPLRKRPRARDALPVPLRRSLDFPECDAVAANRRTWLGRSDPHPVDARGITDQFGIFGVAGWVGVGREQFLAIGAKACDCHINASLF